MERMEGGKLSEKIIKATVAFMMALTCWPSGYANNITNMVCGKFKRNQFKKDVQSTRGEVVPKKG